MPLDGNIERVTARVFAIEDPLPGSKPLLREKAQAFSGNDRPGCVAQALMDLFNLARWVSLLLRR